MKIERIEIRDFRGFPGHYEFKLGKGGHNLLVYGENGSGKSSIFQALKRFFEADTKTNIDTQRNEFSATSEPAIKLEITAYDADGNRDPDSGIFEWSDTAHPSTAPLIQQANKTKGCLDYRALLETHYVHRNKNQVEIFDLLTRTILTNVENPVSNRAFGDELSAIRTDMYKDMRWGGKDSYLRRLRQFNQGLSAILDILQSKTNGLVKEFFGDVELNFILKGKLELTGAGHTKALKYPQVFVAATFCNHQTRFDLHHFLNEARLSAIAIALYLATLLITPPSRLRLLVLDDLLIGIDISNRMAVLKVLRDHFSDWQIILLTHDRVWFETARMSTLGEKTWWYSELYAEIGYDGIPTPLWRGNGEGWTDHLRRAKQHLANHDDRAAGVYARAAFEGKLKKYCNDKGIWVQFKSDPAEINTNMFWKGIKDKLDSQGTLASLQQQIADIEMYRKVVLNPLSHEHPTTLTHAEIQGAIDAIDNLNAVLT